MYVTTRVFLLRMIDERIAVPLQGPIAVGRVCIEPTACLDCEVRCLLYRADREIPYRLHHDGSLAAHPRDQGRSVFVVMTPAGLTLLAAPTRSASQALFSAPTRPVAIGR